jgi:hypothetical protein
MTLPAKQFFGCTVSKSGTIDGIAIPEYAEDYLNLPKFPLSSFSFSMPRQRNGPTSASPVDVIVVLENGNKKA